MGVVIVVGDSVERSLIEAYVMQWPESVTKNMVIVEQGGVPLFHFGIDKRIKLFTPSVTNRTMDKENRQVARISTCESLFGCLIGHSSWIYQFMEDIPNQNPGGYMGGWYIYAFMVPYAIAPTTKLLPDVRLTSERWIVPYKPELWHIPARLIGKFFVHRLILNKRWNWTQPFSLAVEINDDITLPFVEGVNLTKGYWTVDTGERVYGKKKFDVKATQLSKGEYLSLKKVSAELLSHTDVSLERWLDW